MNKKTSLIVSIVIGLLLVGGGAYAYTNNQNDKKEQEKMAMEKKIEDEAMMKKDEAAAMEKEKMANEDQAATNEAGDAMMVKGSFTEYDSSKLANAEKGRVVLFFSASWCPTCQEANKNLNATDAPDGLTLLKVDYDNSTELKKQYGVTYQHTFVQVDKDGNLLKKWSGSTDYDQIEAETI